MEKLAIFGGTPVRETPIAYGKQCVEQEKAEEEAELAEKGAAAVQ